MKRIIFCFDGTWNRVDDAHPTNVLLAAMSIAPTAGENISQIVHYSNGVGTRPAERIRGGVSGKGLWTNIREAYRFLMFNYEPGDAVFVLGFSRGAFSARSFVGFVRAAGIISRDSVGRISEAEKLYKSRRTFDHADMLEFRARYSPHISTCREDNDHRIKAGGYVPGSAHPFRFRYVGLWDTVESLGLAKVTLATLSQKSARKYTESTYRFHVHKVSSIIASGRHAVALDEGRAQFHSEPWGLVADANASIGYAPDEEGRGYQEMFFPGTHGGVGGGGSIRGLSDAAFEWIMEGAVDAGLERRTPESTTARILCQPDFTQPLDNIRKKSGLAKAMDRFQKPRHHRPEGLHEVHQSARDRWAWRGDLPEGKPYRPETLGHLSAHLDTLPHRDPDRRATAARHGGVMSGAHAPAQYHTVQKGETIKSIARATLGDEARIFEIVALNRDIVTRVSRLRPGDVIRLPFGARTGRDPVSHDRLA